MHRHATLNRSFTLAWNEAQQTFVPAPETTRRRGKRSATTTAVAGAVAALFAAAPAHAVDPAAGPTGGRVVAGQATIGQSGAATTIVQGSGKAAIDWQSFDIGRDASVRFVQPDAGSVALNRVVGQNPTQILGSLSANGQVFIVNPNGVLFAPGAQVSAAGVLASTRALSNEDFLAGRYVLQGSGSGSVVNRGRIDVATGGYIALIGAQVVNEGAIVAPNGDVRLAAADQVTLRIDRGGLVAFSVDRGTLDALAANRGLIRADGGRIFLTADALDAVSRAVVNNEGVIEARTVENHSGKIVLMGDMAVGTTVSAGRLDASAPNGGDGGSIETSAAHVQIRAGHAVDTRAANGRTGSYLIDPTDFTVAASGGDTTGAQLSTDLATSNVTIQSTLGLSGTGGNVVINDAVSWSANLLTLHALNDVAINAHLTGTGSAQLALEYGQGALAAGNTGRAVFGASGKVDLPAGANLTMKQGSDGSVDAYTVVTALGADGSSTPTDLQGIRGGLSGFYAIGADIAASATSGYNSGAGFSMLGTFGNAFTGRLEGLGHTISDLTINTGVGSVGLIGELAPGGRLSNLTLTGASIYGGLEYIGGAVGHNFGTIDNVSVQGSVTSGYQTVGGIAGMNEGAIRNSRSSATVTGGDIVGGLVGFNAAGATISGSTSSGTVSGGSQVGGLIGSNDADLHDLHSSATVTATGEATGGLVGYNTGAITASSASGVVNGANLSGGLVGDSTGSIADSSATGNVTGLWRTGGLVGRTNAAVANSHAGGDVSGTTMVGGLIGNSSGPVTGSSATGNVTGTIDSIGGLVGSAGGDISGSYASGTVDGTGASMVGGLVGQMNDAGITTSYATGAVTGADQVGGLVGFGFGGSITLSHAVGDVTATGSEVGGLVGLSGWSIGDAYATGNVIGNSSVGGLVGHGGTTTNSYATGTVTGVNATGGLVGQSKVGGTISGSHASGDVTGTDTATGGLVGRNLGAIEGSSYSTSLVVGASRTGGLVGENIGSVADSATGHAGVAGPVVTGQLSTGGLVGRNRIGATVTNSHATGNVVGSSDATGGLVGDNEGSITASSAIGQVSGQTTTGGLAGHNASNATIDGSVAHGAVVGTGADTGGLVGHSDGAITNSTADNAVTGDLRVGGLVGSTGSTSTIAGSIASGNVSEATAGAGSSHGGLVGENLGSIDTSTASGNVVGTDLVGGLVGGSYGSVSAIVSGSSASGTVTASGGMAGGLIGKNTGAVTLSHATGNVVGTLYTGGAIGYNEGSVADSSAAGTVTGTEQTGGFVGYVGAGSIAGSTATGTLVTGTTMVGGFVGWNGAAIGNSSATAAVLASDDMVGGFAGRNEGGLTHVSAAGNVSGTASNEVGGLVGRHAGSTAFITGGSVANGNVDATGAGKGQDVGGYVGSVQAGAMVSGGAQAHGTVTAIENVGGFVGNLDDGSITAAISTGSVTGQTSVGGFAGRTGSGTVVTASSASGAVAGSVQGVGGFVGNNGTLLSGNAVDGVAATGTVTSTGNNTGGFAGGNNGTLSEIHAANAVSGTVDTGGLVGLNFGRVEKSWTTNAVTASGDVAGGLVGENVFGTVTRSYAAGSVNGQTHVGGAVGLNNGDVNISYSNASVQGLDNVGGLIGTAGGISTVTNAYATGPVSGRDNVGGLIGNANGSVQFTYSASAVTATGVAAGGLIGGNAGAVVTDSYFDTTRTGQIHSSGDHVATGEVALGKTTAEMNRADTFTGWDLATDGTHLNVWRSYDGAAAPLLTYWLTPLTITGTASPINSVYDGQSHTAQVANSAWVDTLSPGHVLGTASYASGRNAGSYAATSGYYSDQQGYDLTQATTALVITPAPLGAALVGVSKVYDGSTAATLAAGQYLLTGFVAGEGAGVTQTVGSFNGRNVRDASSVSAQLAPGDFAAFSGTDLANYILPASASGAAAIVARSINVTVTASNKVYDGTTAAQAALATSGFVQGDSVGLAGIATFSDKNAGIGKTVSVGSLATTGADASNYSIATPTVTTTADVARRSVNVGATGIDKVYDGTTTDAVTLVATGVLGADDLRFVGTGLLADRNVGSGKSVAVSIAAAGVDAGNYAWNTGAVTTANVTPAPLAAALVGVGKVYDGSTTATLAAGQYRLTGFVVGEGAGVTQTVGSFNGRNVRDATSVSAQLAPGNFAAFYGTDLGNYILPATASGSARISARPIDVTVAVSNKVYDGTTAAQAVLATTGFLPGDAVGLAGTATFADRNAGTGKAVSVDGIAATGIDASNYRVASPTVAATADVARRSVNVGATGIDKVYDGTTTDAVTLVATGVLGADDVRFSGTGLLADRNVGNAKAVTVSIAAAGTDAANYVWNTGAATTANVAPRALGVDLQGKVVGLTDGSTTAHLDGTNFSIQGVAPGDSIRIGSAVGQYDAATPGVRLVTVTLGAADFQAGSGTLLGNYVFGDVTLSAPIGVLLSSNTLASALVSLPNTPSGDSQAAGLDASIDNAANRTVERRQVSDPLAPAQGSVVSTNTKENLLFRRTFSIGDGGIRLPQGVRGSEKDAAQ